ncbi:MAG: hypothetical protein U0637_11705 [Phycisphaerales bacterium]
MTAHAPVALACAACSALLTGCHSPPPRPVAPPSAHPTTTETTLSLLRTCEHRESFAPATSLETAGLFLEGIPSKGEWLMFDIAVPDVPPSTRIVDAEFIAASATDNLGADLVGPLIRQYQDHPGDVRDWTSQTLRLHDAAPTLRWFVQAPSRSATTVNASLRIKLRVSDARDTITINPTRDWQAFDHGALKDLNAQYRWSADGSLTRLSIRPRAAETMIFFLSPRPPQFRGRPHWSSADSQAMSYLLANNTPEAAPVTLQTFANIRTIDAVLTLSNHPLP